MKRNLQVTTFAASLAAIMSLLGSPAQATPGSALLDPPVYYCNADTDFPYQAAGPGCYERTNGGHCLDIPGISASAFDAVAYGELNTAGCWNEGFGSACEMFGFTEDQDCQAPGVNCGGDTNYVWWEGVTLTAQWVENGTCPD